MENFKNYKQYFLHSYTLGIKNKLNNLREINATLDASNFEAFDTWRTREDLTSRQYELFKNQDFKKLKMLLDKQIIKEERKLEEKKAEALKKYEELALLEDIDNVTIHVDWSAGRRSLGAYQTMAQGSVFYKNGTSRHFETGYTGGCGYDKPSTSLSEFCNATLKILLVKHGAKILKDANKHYKFYACEPLYFQYGVGVSSYETMFRNMGYNVKIIYRGKNYDNFTMLISRKCLKIGG